jgi:GH35 family endo-1,4-beta-xylanase
MKLCVFVSYLLLLCVSLAFAIEENGEKIEENVLAQADKDIEKYRKSDAVIEVVDRKGKPIKKAVVRVNQINSDFLFAANVTLITGDLGGKIPIEHYQFQPRLKTQAEEDEFKKKFAELFNCATIPLYWNSVEPVKDKPDFSAVDRILEWCKSQDIKVKGHTLVWVHGDNVPQWFRDLPTDEQRKTLGKRSGMGKDNTCRHDDV